MSLARSPGQATATVVAGALARWPRTWLLGGGVLALLSVVAVTATLGPLLGLALIGAVGVGMIIFRFPNVALALPVVMTPVGLRAIPGGGGLQLIHIAVLGALGGLLVAVGNGLVPFRPPTIMAFGLLFVASMFASTVVSDHPLASLRVGVNHLLGVSLAIAVAVAVRSSLDYLWWLMRAWVVASCLLIVPALPSALQASELFGGGLVEGRVQGVFNQPNDFGEFCLLSSVMAGALLAARHSQRDRWIGTVGLVVGVTGSAASFSRGTWLGVAGCLIAVAALSSQLRRWVSVMVAGMSLTLLVGAALGQAPFPTLLLRFLGLFNGVANPEDDRQILWDQAIRVFRESPGLGVGPGGYLSTQADPGSLLILRTYLHGHSIVLTVAAELGVIGVVALLGFTVALAIGTLSARRRLLSVGNVSENAVLAVLAGGLVGLAVHGLIDVVYTNPLLIPLAWCLAGMVAGLGASVTDRISDPKSRPVSA